MKKNFWDEIEKSISSSNLSETEKKLLFSNLMNLKNNKINILITGATGSGKSSTINAIFDMEIAKVGYGVDPETMDIQKYELENIVLWDSPGLGDGIEADIKHSKNIIDKLAEKDKDNNALIDLVLVIIDGSSRDMGTSYALINEVIIPNMVDKERILVAINQCDVAMKGKNWNHEEKKPNNELEKFLNEKVESVQKRVVESTGVNITPIFYSASECYNLSKLLSFIIKYTPKSKRAIYIDNINKDPNPWKSNDDLRDYNQEIKKNIMESVLEGISKGSDTGGRIGKALAGEVGEVAGKVIGGLVGGAVEVGKSLWNNTVGKWFK